MKSFVALIFAVALVEFASAVTKERLDKVKAAKDKCAKEHNIEESAILDAIYNKKLPETEEGKCLVACFMEEMKLIVDGKPDIEEWKSSNKETWEDQGIVDKADEIAKECIEKVSSEGKNKCQYSVDLLECVLVTAIEREIPKPDIKNPKRR